MSRRRRADSSSQIKGSAKGSVDVRQQVKVCPTCDRPFHNRRKWEARGLWDSIVYCSERCRRTRP